MSGSFVAVVAVCPVGLGLGFEGTTGRLPPTGIQAKIGHTYLYHSWRCSLVNSNIRPMVFAEHPDFHRLLFVDAPTHAA